MIERGNTAEKNQEREEALTVRTKTENLPSVEFVKVEKNLASLGFFTPSSKRSRNSTSKSVIVMMNVDGTRIETRATIAPTALFGLPITADQDKWLALHKILTDVQAREGRVDNPVSFTSAELLALLRIYKDSGKNYRDVSDWLDVMVGTTIISEGAVYISGQRTFKKDTFHVFDRAVSFGRHLPDGSIADKNYVWLSEWQLKNINDHHQLPIDLDTYRQLKNHIAKALVPLLQIWLYATRDQGVFEKRYDELCQILNVRQYEYPSIIKQTLGQSLDELTQFEYLADWQVEKTTDGKNYKILFYHGEKFHRDRRMRLARKKDVPSEPIQSQDVSAQSPTLPRSSVNIKRRDQQQERKIDRLAGVKKEAQENLDDHASAAVSPSFDPGLVTQFTRRGVTEKRAVALLANLKPGQDIVAQLELCDHMVERSRVPIVNPPGFYIRMVEANTSVPEWFETSAKRKAREGKTRREEEKAAAWEAEQDRLEEEERRGDAALDQLQASDPEGYATLYSEAEQAIIKDFPSFGKWADRDGHLHIRTIRSRMKKLLSERPAAEQFASSEPQDITDHLQEQGSVPSLFLEPIAEIAVAPAPPMIERAMDSMNAGAAALTPIEAAEPTSVENPTVPDLAPESVALEAATSGEISAEERASEPAVELPTAIESGVENWTAVEPHSVPEPLGENYEASGLV